MNLSEYEENEENTVVENETEVDTIANILTNAVSTNSTTNTTVNANQVNTNKVLNEELIVLYNGLILDTTKMDEVELKYIDNSSTEKDKYVITYYNYENFAFEKSSLGQISQQIFDNLVGIDGVGKIAISEEYIAIPREAKVINTLPTAVLDNNTKLSDYDSVKTIIADLDGNGTDEYITILANKKTGYSKIALYDVTGSLVAELADIEKTQWNSELNVEYYLSLSNVNIIDIDNDNIMEILVEIPKYEGEPSVSLLKYKNNELLGKKNIHCSLLP